MNKYELAAYELSEWASLMIRECGTDAIGVWDMNRDKSTEKLTSEDIPAINSELSKYNSKEPDEKGKYWQAILESINGHTFTVRIRYAKSLI